MAASAKEGDEGGEQEPVTILLIGKTGAGKSTLGNFFLGYSEGDGRNPPFRTSANVESETSDMKIENGLFFGDKTRPIRLIDCPGFADSKGQDDQFADKLQNIMKVAGYVHVLLWCKNGAEDRVDINELNQLKSCLDIFGAYLFENMVMNLSKWTHDKKAEERRTKSGKRLQNFRKGLKQSLVSHGISDVEVHFAIFALDALYDDTDEVEVGKFEEIKEEMWDHFRDLARKKVFTKEVLAEYIKQKKEEEARTQKEKEEAEQKRINDAVNAAVAEAKKEQEKVLQQERERYKRELDEAIQDLRQKHEKERREAEERNDRKMQELRQNFERKQEQMRKENEEARRKLDDELRESRKAQMKLVQATHEQIAALKVEAAEQRAKMQEQSMLREQEWQQRVHEAEVQRQQLQQDMVNAEAARKHEMELQAERFSNALLKQQQQANEEYQRQLQEQRRQKESEKAKIQEDMLKQQQGILEQQKQYQEKLEKRRLEGEKELEKERQKADAAKQRQIEAEREHSRRLQDALERAQNRPTCSLM